MADRYTYIPLVGLFIVIAWGANDIFDKNCNKRFYFCLLSGFLTFFLAQSSWLQLEHWRDSTNLFSRIVTIDKDNYRFRYLLGKALAKEGEIDRAIENYERALNLNEDYTEARIKYFQFLLERNMEREAFKHLRILLHKNVDNEYVFNDIAIVFLNRLKFHFAAAFFFKAISLNPEYEVALNNLYAMFEILRRNSIIHHQKKNVHLSKDKINEVINHIDKIDELYDIYRRYK